MRSSREKMVSNHGYVSFQDFGSLRFITIEHAVFKQIKSASRNLCVR